MQAANVHAILESGPFVHKVQARLNDSIALIDDLDETLAIFDLKLRHMREDIAAIESRNNRCSLTTLRHVTMHHHQSMLMSCGISQQAIRRPNTMLRSKKMPKQVLLEQLGSSRTKFQLQQIQVHLHISA